MKTRLTAALTIAGSSALLLAACSNSTDAGGMSGMEHSGSGMSSAASTPAPSSSTHNAQDVSFAQGMAMHHLQAIEMADMVLGKQGVDVKVTSLATAIKAAQQPEIDEMNGWLTSWGETEVTTSTGGASGMAMGDGMMSQDDMDALQNASGATASSLFLTQMIQHHQGAVEMARTEVSQGASTEAITLAKTIIRDQTAQIAQMKRLLQQV